MGQHALNDDTSTLLAFRLLAEEVSVILNNMGTQTLPYRDPSLPIFTKVSSEKKARAVRCLSAYRDVLLSIQNSADCAKANSRALWHALKVLQLRAPEDTFLQIDPEDALEIYTIDGIQVWRNMKTLEVVSYTLEEVHSLDWTERYHRDPGVTERVMERVIATVSGDGKRAIEVDVPAHVIHETCSEEKLSVEVNHKLLFPLKNEDGSMAGFLASTRARIVDSVSQPKPRPALTLVNSPTLQV